MIRKVFLALAASTALIAGTAQAASEFFIKIAGISGTSDVRGFEDYLDVISYSLGFTRGTCQDLAFTKLMDAASPDITGAALLGTVYPSAILVGRKVGAEPVMFVRLTLTNVAFTSVSVGAFSGGEGLPVESVALQPASVKIEAFEQDATGTPVVVATNTVTCQKVK